jgi:hypothetical protein
MKTNRSLLLGFLAIAVSAARALARALGSDEVAFDMTWDRNHMRSRF